MKMNIRAKIQKMTTKQIRSRITKLKQSKAFLSQAEIIVLMSELNFRGIEILNPNYD